MVSATAIAIFDGRSRPNTSTTIGASASFGIAWKAISSGSTMRAQYRDHQNDSPIAVPRPVPITKPHRVERKVYHVSLSAVPDCTVFSHVAQIADGVLQKKASSQPIFVAASQATMM